MSQTRMAFFGSSLVSSCWNGAAAYYRCLPSCDLVTTYGGRPPVVEAAHEMPLAK